MSFVKRVEKSWWSTLRFRDKVELLGALFVIGSGIGAGGWAVWTHFDKTSDQIAEQRRLLGALEVRLGDQEKLLNERFTTVNDRLATEVRQLNERFSAVNDRLATEARQDASRAALISACTSMAIRASELSRLDDGVSTNRVLSQRLAMGCDCI